MGVGSSLPFQTKEEAIALFNRVFENNGEATRIDDIDVEPCDVRSGTYHFFVKHVGVVNPALVQQYINVDPLVARIPRPYNTIARLHVPTMSVGVLFRPVYVTSY
jgi:hypothetical protein